MISLAVRASLLALFFVLTPSRTAGQSSAVLGAFGAADYSLRADQVGLVVNQADPVSLRVGEYYRNARRIPARNVVRVSIPGSPRSLSADRFNQLCREIEAGLDSSVQAVVMVWTAPYAVECNSITAAFTRGFDGGQCRRTCRPGRANPYFDSFSVRPYGDFGMRLSMLLPTQSEAAARALIDRGVRSDGSAPAASAYYLVTSDAKRSSRARFFPPSAQIFRPPFTIRALRAESIEGRRDIMIYQTGRTSVPRLETLGFLPGALADHLTSSGGKLLGSDQMSSLKWLEAGATASYGTVSEPCNYWQKFPNPAVLLKHYLNGASAIEAYWKSVAWPAQGVFIGEPLASPYRRTAVVPGKAPGAGAGQQISWGSRNPSGTADNSANRPGR